MKAKVIQQWVLKLKFMFHSLVFLTNSGADCLQKKKTHNEHIRDLDTGYPLIQNQMSEPTL